MKIEDKPVSLLASRLTGITGSSLTWRPKRPLCCLLVEVIKEKFYTIIKYVMQRLNPLCKFKKILC